MRHRRRNSRTGRFTRLASGRAGKRCPHCGGGIYYGEHYPNCPRSFHAPHKPSAGGYGVFQHSSGNGYVTRSMDDLRHPYRPEMAVRVFKRRGDADKYADKLNSGSRRRRRAA